MRPGAFEVRAYRPGDEAGVVALWNAVFADDPAWNEPHGVIARKLTVQPQLFLVAAAASGVVGTTLAGYDGVRGWVHHVASAPDWRGRGVARALLAASVDGLRTLGCVKLNLQVRVGNERARRFYARLGFTEEARTSMGLLLVDTD